MAPTAPASGTEPHTFYDMAIAQGYSPEFLKKVICAEDCQQSASRGSSTGQGASSDSLKKFLEDLTLVKSFRQRTELVRDKINADDLDIHNRIDMDLIARLLNGYCYSACVSSATKFCRDILGEPRLGNTWKTLRRYMDNVAQKHDEVVNEEVQKVKTLYFDTNHISQYPFTGALQTNTDTIKQIASLFAELEFDETAERKLTELWVGSESNRSLIEDMSGKWPWLVEHAEGYEKRTRSERKKLTSSEMNEV